MEQRQQYLAITVLWVVQGTVGTQRMGALARQMG